MADKAKNVLEALLEGTDYKDVLSKEQKDKITSLINETVDTRVSAKEKLLDESFKNKEATLIKETEDLKKKLSTEADENEKALVEEAEKYKQILEESVIKQTKEFKEESEKKLTEIASKYRTEIESVVFTEAKEYKAKKDAALIEEVKQFKGEMIERVSDYLEAKLSTLVPTEMMESATKLTVYEPLVISIMEAFSKNFIKLDDSSYQLIKESKDRIAALEKDLQTAKKETIALSKQKREVEKQAKISNLLEGLTEAQRSKGRKLLESSELEELDKNFTKIRDIIVESESKPTPKVEPKIESKKVEKINENIKTETPVKPIQNDTAIKMQMKKVLSESETKEINPEKKIELSEKEITVNNWANKVIPKHARG